VDFGTDEIIVEDLMTKPNEIGTSLPPKVELVDHVGFGFFGED